MRYLYKRDIATDNRYVAISANCETKDYRRCRILELREDTASELDLTVRKVFNLGTDDEVVLDFQGLWNSRESDNTIDHPFVDGVRIPVEIRR